MTKAFTDEQRYQWIKNWIVEHGQDVDVLDQNFVDAYIAAFNAPFKAIMFGAHKCKQLGSDLSRMFAAGILDRWACGLPGDSGMGYPKWIYCYSLKD